jgi:hypothetical protein
MSLLYGAIFGQLVKQYLLLYLNAEYVVME